MIKREISQLAVYRIKNETEALSLSCLQNLYMEKTSEIVYIIKENRLYGIVSMGDILHHRDSEGGVKINKTFTSLTGFNLIKAREIFKARTNIHKIPVINEKGELIGDYSRWDDMLYIERNQKLLMQEEIVRNLFKKYETVYVIEPVANGHSDYIQLVEYLERFEVKYIMLNKGDIEQILLEQSICIFLNEDERRGVQCLYGIELGSKYDMPVDTRYKVRFSTYKSLLVQLMQEYELIRLGIKSASDLSNMRIDDKATILLSSLEKRGIKCFCLYPDENELTEYGRKFKNEVNERLKYNPIDSEREEFWPKKVENEEFYGELYQLEDYENESAQKNFGEGAFTFENRDYITGKYFNAKNGIRVTCFQPEEYVGTIYILGPCMIVGAYVEDQYTIPSYLQKKLLEQGYNYRVENYGSVLRLDAKIDSRIEEIGKFHENDIVVYLSVKGKAVDISGNSLEKIFEEHKIPSEWVVNAYVHCNHKANQLVADSIFEMVIPCLEEKDNDKDIHIDVYNVMKDYVQQKYLNQYFSHFCAEDYNTVGAIVMNCNPFSKGHRYLIEQARKQVEFLIIFAVEENASLFSFEERIKLIMEGTRDLDNVMVVPSGDFVLSKNNFREYFGKRETEAAVLGAEYDINVFADYIAGPLHITHRFAGEELEDRVTEIYNKAMAKILPPKGITFVEIPRIAVEGETVSASKVRKYLKDEEYNKAFDLLPDTTKQYLMKQI